MINLRPYALLLPLLLLTWTAGSHGHESTAEREQEFSMNERSSALADGYAPAWIRKHDGLGHQKDRAGAMTVDSAGNVYVTGFSSGASLVSYFMTIKYSPAGKQLWAKAFGTQYLSAGATCIAVDASGNVYVAGDVLKTDDDYDIAIIKYSPGGSQLWQRLFHGEYGYDMAKGIGVDREGNVYVAGVSYQGGERKNDLLVLKYSATGEYVWGKAYNGPKSDWDCASALTVDAAGSVYVTGATGISAYIGLICDFVTLKLDTTGVLKWIDVYDGPANGDDQPSAMTLKGSYVYITGYSQKADGTQDYLTLKYSRAGKRVWVAGYDGPSKKWDNARAIAVDAPGNVYVTGESYGAGSYDFATVKYRPDGSRSWVKRYNGAANLYDAANALSIGSTGNIFVTGSSSGTGADQTFLTIQYSPAGKVLWTHKYNGSPGGMDEARFNAVDMNGNLYVSGNSRGMETDPNASDWITIKYSPR